MNAKDTVMNEKQMLEALIGASIPPSLDYEIELMISKAQAEVSFKAGIKEVVNFISSPCIKHKDAIGYPSRLNWHICWQAKLKEWGFSPEVKE